MLYFEITESAIEDTDMKAPCIFMVFSLDKVKYYCSSKILSHVPLEVFLEFFLILPVLKRQSMIDLVMVALLATFLSAKRPVKSCGLITYAGNTI